MNLVRLCALAACGLTLTSPGAGPPTPLRAPTREPNLAPYIPPQCYAITRDAAGVHNPCFVCHQDGPPPSYVRDADLQTASTFPAYATVNRWANALAAPPSTDGDDAETLRWVRASNYQVQHDCHFDVDDEGFDRDPRGALTGWRAYAYLPVPGMFWPTNGGSAGDAFVRLPAEYRQDAAGKDDRRIYRLNLAIAEAYLRRADVPIDETDERAEGVDLDADGHLGTAHRVAFVWPPKAPLHYLGRAGSLQPATAGLFPQGTELLHTLRYLDVRNGRVVPAARMKEVRYMQKVRWLGYADLELLQAREAREEVQNPDRLEKVRGDREHGVGTGRGWRMEASIEDARGALRPQSYEELGACVGCHGGIGAGVDGTFSFARKLGAEAFAGGWFHQGHRDEPLPERKRSDGQGEYAHYLAEVGGGDDFRSNDEIARGFFGPDGKPNHDALRTFAGDVRRLIVPSATRALRLDHAYRRRVESQSFVLGRDVVIGAPPQIAAEVAPDAPTGVRTVVTAE
ncbi:MAG: hypothetical protein HOO96_05365 [Polyangiaceae bacterium]|nr:hypothetical protein [Polyangiaceae bacterium]